MSTKKMYCKANRYIGVCKRLRFFDLVGEPAIIFKVSNISVFVFKSKLRIEADNVTMLSKLL